MTLYKAWWPRILALLFMGALLFGVFEMYRQPVFMLQLSNQIWGCI